MPDSIVVNVNLIDADNNTKEGLRRLTAEQIEDIIDNAVLIVLANRTGKDEDCKQQIAELEEALFSYDIVDYEYAE